MDASLAPVTRALIAEQPIADAHVSADGLQITDLTAVLGGYGADAAALAPHVPKVMAGGVQSAPTGAVQDPAGSAIGARGFGAGGASGAIYGHFNGLPKTVDHLEFIPDMPPGASIFNASMGAGGRVLHTHSPMLGTPPGTPDGRGATLTALANAYGTALLAFDAHKDMLVDDGALLNLVPVSAAIFAGPFAAHLPGYPRNGHLHPSYTFAAVLLAASAVLATGAAVPDLTIYYFDDAVRADAGAIAAALA